MKVASGLVMIAAGLAFSASALAAMPSEFDNSGHFEELRITKTDGSAVILTDANIASGTIHGTSDEVGFDAVRKLEYKTGSRSKAGSIWGGIIGCGLGVGIALGTMKTETEDSGYIQTETTTIQLWPVWIFGLGGSLLGMAIGSGSHTYATLYDEDSHARSESPRDSRLGLALTPAGAGQTPYLTLSYRF